MTGKTQSSPEFQTGKERSIVSETANNSNVSTYLQTDRKLENISN